MFDPAGRSAPQLRQTAKNTAEADELKLRQQQLDKAAAMTGRLRFGMESLPAVKINDKEFFASDDPKWAIISGLQGYVLTNDPARLDEVGIDVAMAEKLRGGLG